MVSQTCVASWFCRSSSSSSDMKVSRSSTAFLRAFSLLSTSAFRSSTDCDWTDSASLLLTICSSAIFSLSCRFNCETKTTNNQELHYTSLYPIIKIDQDQLALGTQTFSCSRTSFSCLIVPIMVFSSKISACSTSSFGSAWLSKVKEDVKLGC